MVLRTRRRAWRSKPSRLLLITTLVVSALALALPYSGPFARLFGIQPPSVAEFAALLAIVLGYVAATELLKYWFYAHKIGREGGRRAATASVAP